MQSLHILLLTLVSQPRATPVPPCLVLTIGQVPDAIMWCLAHVLFGWKALIQYIPSLILYQRREFMWFKHLRASCGSGPPRQSSWEEALLHSSVEGSTSKTSSASKYTWLSRYCRLLLMRHLLRELQWKDKAPYSSSSPPCSHEGGKSSLPLTDTSAQWQAVHFASLKPYVLHGLPVVPFLMGMLTGTSP